MKFTEEQYQKIVEIQEESFPKTIISEGISINDGGFWKVVSEKIPLLSEYVCDNDLHFELAALANPLTREWAHDKFVEKEKKYVWNLKGQHKHTDRIRLFKDLSDNSVSNYWAERYSRASEQEKLTESEIKSWGYNPEMFDREEVQ